MKKVILLITLIMIGTAVSFGQGTVSRSTKQKTEQKKAVPKKKTQAQQLASPKNIPNQLTSDNTDELLFPLYGITLGKTTLKDAIMLDLTVDKSGLFSKICIDKEIFMAAQRDEKGREVFSSYSNTRYGKMPEKWTSIDFSWTLSYNQWIELLTKLGYRIEVISEPHSIEYDNKKTLKARFKAIPLNGNIELEFNFNYGSYGDTKDSSESLYEIVANYRNI